MLNLLAILTLFTCHKENQCMSIGCAGRNVQYSTSPLLSAFVSLPVNCVKFARDQRFVNVMMLINPLLHDENQRGTMKAESGVFFCFVFSK